MLSFSNSFRVTTRNLLTIRAASAYFPTTTTTTVPTSRSFTSTTAIMGVSKTVLKEGNGAIPKAGDKVTIEYTGYLKDTSKPAHKGDK
jgi:FKBP-type peptidyl-prolyl cis-trans isomerase